MSSRKERKEEAEGRRELIGFERWEVGRQEKESSHPNWRRDEQRVGCKSALEVLIYDI